MTKTLPTRNADWGFHGEMQRREGIDPVAAFACAQSKILNALGGDEHADEAVRAFLDSRHGRHFGDDVNNALADGHGLEAAIDAAIARWMGWRISRATEREYGIPRGTPHLTGFVIHCGIEAEALEADAG